MAGTAESLAYAPTNLDLTGDEIPTAYIGQLEAAPEHQVLMLDFDTASESSPFVESEDTPLPNPNTVRPPESEIYGRSLSTIHRYGVYIVAQVVSEDKVAAETVHSPEAQQARVEFRTSCEEGLGTDIELGAKLKVEVFDRRPVIGGKVMSKDLKTAISDMTGAGLINAEQKFKRESDQGNYRFKFQYTRSGWDHKNALACDAMARDETEYNTIMVVTPFPQEAAVDCGAEYVDGIGYVSPFRRGFVQLYHGGKNGFLSGSISFDGSDKRRLREVFGRRDIEVSEDEITDNWLKYAITGNFTEEEAKAYALQLAKEAGDPKYNKTTNTVDITTEHEKIMDKAFDESYIHACESLARGYQTPELRELIFQFANNSESFNPRYRRALYEMRADKNRFTDDDMVVVHELLVYSTIEMMRALHIKKTETTHTGQSKLTRNEGSEAAYLQSINQASFQSRLAGFGADGARHNRTYSACGLSISIGDSTTAEDNPQYAYGGVDFERSKENSNEDCEFISKECPLCRAKNVKTIVKKVSSTHKRIIGDCGCSTTVRAD